MAYRALLAFVLSLLVIVIFNYFFAPKPPVKKPLEIAKSVEKKEVKKIKEIKKEALIYPEEKAKELGREIIVSTPLYKVIFCERGARIKGFILKKYRQTVDPSSSPQEIIFSKAPYLPLGIRFLQQKISLNNLLFKANRIHLNVSKKPQTLNFVAELNGLNVQKQFVFYPDDYRIDFYLKFLNKSNKPFQDNVSIILANQWLNKTKYGFYGGVAFINKKFEEIKMKKIKGEVIKTGELLWAGLSDKYFTTLIINPEGKKGTFILQKKKDTLLGELIIPPIEIKPSEEKTISFLLYFGPKEIKRLKKLGFHLDNVVQFGFFAPLVKILLYALNWFYKFTHNYGIAIILLTIVIKILFWPLTHKSFKSMQDLQKLQPHIARIRKQYKDDKEALNRELMNLYRTYKVNPFGGCLPIFLQIPVFFALYKLLLHAIELRHAPFITYLPFTKKIWLADLSAKDPYYITPILMGISMVVQQKMTPSSLDPKQSKFMLLVPIFFTFLFLNFPSGLVLYWLVNNILSIIQQFYINRKIK
ncbi:MAG TPA: membrane protein insertase YidC [Candidatus Desulfofervidus auxilii]|uniref:Membrane protein insertase YidC n=1 Tax=Desulfofervidus auxilii TaxID=1621989 RepID=A0A7C0U323_DESA2|nr:membrane protein insertase YidC [Candidatus Desulfofervidus auxilii]